MALYSLAALRGLRTRLYTFFVVLMLIVITFIVFKNAILGFPWEGCIHEIKIEGFWLVMGSIRYILENL